MKILLRTIFVVLLILTLSTQTIRITRQAQSDDTKAFSDGVAKLRAKIVTAPSPDRVATELPGCSRPVIIARVGFAGTNEAMLNVPDEKWTRRYVYLGVVDSRLDFAELLSRWTKAATLATLALRPTAAPGSVVQVLLPKECPDLIDRDWSVLSPSS
jgi:hypothetical protein